MTIQIEEYEPVAMDTVNKNPNFQKLGHIRIVGKTLDLWLEVIKSSKGAIFFRVPQIKVGAAWKKAYTVIGKEDFEKWVKEEVGKEFEAKYC